MAKKATKCVVCGTSKVRLNDFEIVQTRKVKKKICDGCKASVSK